MNAIGKVRYAFGRYDRITINGDTYRWVKFLNGRHEFQRVTESVEEQILENDCISYSDDEIHTLNRRKVLRQEAAYYSKALTELRMRQDNTDLTGLNEEDVRTLFWKREWCVRFNRARAGIDGYTFRPTLGNDDLEHFVDLNKDDMAKWYFKRYGEHRRPGRPAMVKQKDGTRVLERKMQDYPGPTALRNWLRDYKAANNRIEAFIHSYGNCGRRDQLDAEVDAIVRRMVKGYSALNRPEKKMIYEDIGVELKNLNSERRNKKKLSVSITTVSRRINSLNPFAVAGGRLSPDVAIRAYAPAGQGLEVEDFMDRLEIDDWTVDLFALICKSHHWPKLTEKQKRLIPRVRATITIVIDCATRCIVGLYISETTPTTAAAKAALRTVLIDKDEMAKLAGADSDWPMQGKPRLVVSDGGSVFKEEFERAVLQVRSERVMPDHDPRMRGYVEAVNRTMKAFCRYFTGQSFANVVEKGEYNGEAMASLDFETFRNAFTLFVVDKYHRRPHRGLANMSPYAKWEQLTNRRRELPMDEVRQIAVFGFRTKDVGLDKHGVLSLNVSYWSPHLGLLFTILGHKGTVNLVIDPTDIGRLLVEVPKKRREELRSMALMHKVPMDPRSTNQFLIVPSTDTTLHGKSLVDLSEMRADLKAAAEATRERDEAFCLRAHESLTRISRKAAREVGIADHLLSQKQWETLVSIFKQKARAADPLGNGDTAAEPVGEQQATIAEGHETDDIQNVGTHVARGRPTGHPRSSQAKAEDDETLNAPAESQEAITVKEPNRGEDESDAFTIPDLNDTDEDHP